MISSGAEIETDAKGIGTSVGIRVDRPRSEDVGIISISKRILGIEDCAKTIVYRTKHLEIQSIIEY